MASTTLPPAADPLPWRAALLDLWERLFWLRIAVGLGLGIFILLKSGMSFYDEYRLGRDGVGVEAILPEQLPPPPYRLGAFYPMPLRFLDPQTRATIEIKEVQVPGEALRAVTGGDPVVFRYLPADPRVSDFPSYENRPWAGLAIGLVLFMGSALAGLARVGAEPLPAVEAIVRPPEQQLSGLGPEPGPLPPPLPAGRRPEPLAGVDWAPVAGAYGSDAPAYLHAGRDPPSRLPAADNDDPETRPFQPVELDLDQIDPPLPAYVPMLATGAAQAGEWRLGQSDEALAMSDPEAASAADVAPQAHGREARWLPPMPIPEAEPMAGTQAQSVDAHAAEPLNPVSLPVFGFATSPLRPAASPGDSSKT